MTSLRISSLTVFAAALLAAILIAPASSFAGGTKSYASNGVISACFKARGANKGALRVVRPKQRCRHGERRVRWFTGSKEGPTGATGQTGPAGKAGTNGAEGPRGPIDETLKTVIDTQKTTIDKLTARLTSAEELLDGVAANANKLTGVTLAQLEGVIANAGKLNGISLPQLESTLANAGKLNGISLSQLEGGLTNASKLAGISGTELTNAVNGALASLPQIAALCTQTELLHVNTNSQLSALGGIALDGVIPLNLKLTIPSLPAALAPFACS